MLGVVIVLLGFHTRIRYVIDLDRHAKFSCGGFYHLGQVQNRELLGKLVVNAALAFGGGVITVYFDTSYPVPPVEEAASLAARPVHHDRLARDQRHAYAP